MAGNDATITITGWVGSNPTLYTGQNTRPYSLFRMGNTRRYFDAKSGEWRDGTTTWWTVKAWNDRARNIAASLRKGDPVVVFGRPRAEVWESEEGPRATQILEALAVGPDLSHVQCRPSRVAHQDDPGAASEQEPELDPAAEGAMGPQDGEAEQYLPATPVSS